MRWPGAHWRSCLAATALLVAALPAAGQERLVDRVPTNFVENGKAVSLEIVIFKPGGAGPFPTMMFNHGSTGRGDNPALFTNTWTHGAISRFFNERGWLIAFPQRRGRGKSDGLYDEGFEANRSGYSCWPQLSLPGMERALQDLDAAVDYLKRRDDVDATRMLIGGQSRGGILAIVYAGTRPDRFRGAINFVGGWMSDRCRDAETLNTASFRRGGAFPGPTLWLYGDNDPFYRLAHSRGNFDAFVGAGGKGAFLSYVPPSGNGHGVINHPDLWASSVASFVQQLQ